jgi:hypothetical protein
MHYQDSSAVRDNDIHSPTEKRHDLKFFRIFLGHSYLLVLIATGSGAVLTSTSTLPANSLTYLSTSSGQNTDVAVIGTPLAYIVTTTFLHNGQEGMQGTFYYLMSAKASCYDLSSASNLARLHLSLSGISGHIEQG